MKREFISLRQKCPVIAGQWVSGEKEDQTPDNVPYSAHVRVLWKCDRGHLYTASVNQRTARNSSCPYCESRKVLKGENDLETCNRAVAEQWHPWRNGTLMPDEVLPNSTLKVWWQCERGHSWAATIETRNRGSKCPYCVGRTPVRMHFV